MCTWLVPYVLHQVSKLARASNAPQFHQQCGLPTISHITYTYTHTHTHLYAHTMRTHMHTLHHTHTHTHTHIYICVSVCVYVSVHVADGWEVALLEELGLGKLIQYICCRHVHINMHKHTHSVHLHTHCVDGVGWTTMASPDKIGSITRTQTVHLHTHTHTRFCFVRVLLGLLLAAVVQGRACCRWHGRWPQGGSGARSPLNFSFSAGNRAMYCGRTGEECDVLRQGGDSMSR